MKHNEYDSKNELLVELFVNPPNVLCPQKVGQISPISPHSGHRWVAMPHWRVVLPCRVRGLVMWRSPIGAENACLGSTTGLSWRYGPSSEASYRRTWFGRSPGRTRACTRAVSPCPPGRCAGPTPLWSWLTSRIFQKIIRGRSFPTLTWQLRLLGHCNQVRAKKNSQSIDWSISKRVTSFLR